MLSLIFDKLIFKFNFNKIPEAVAIMNLKKSPIINFIKKFLPQKSSKSNQNIKNSSKGYQFWLAIFTVYFFGRLPNLFMPHWNFDEGVYLSIASDLNYGGNLYTDSWDHKPPILYWLYTFLLKISADQYFIIPLFNFFLGFLTIILIFKIAEHFVSKKFSYIAAIIATIFLSFGFWEAAVFNGENLFVPLILGSILVFLRKETGWTNFLVGFLIFLATAVKIHAVVELVGFFIGYLMLKKLDYKQIIVRYFQIISVVSAFWAGLFGYFYYLNQFKFSFDSIFTYNSQYSQQESSDYATFLGAPTGVIDFGITDLQWRVLLLTIFTVLLTYFSLRIKEETKIILFLFWFVFSFFAVLLSGRNYSHYLIQIIPTICIGFCIIYSSISNLWQENISKLFKTRLFPLFISIFVWLVLVQNLVFIFASGLNSSNISLDVFPVEITYRNFYTSLGYNELGKWQNEIKDHVYKYYPMEEIISTSKELTSHNQRFWHYSNFSALCFYVQRQCNYTAHLWFHLEGKVLEQTINKLETDPPNTIFVDSDIRTNSEIQNYINKNYTIQKTLPDKFNNSPRYQFWVLKKLL